MSESLAHGAAIVSALVLGVSAGALVAEGAVLVPFWRSLQPDAFLRWYRENAALLLRFFGPLEIAAALGALAAAVLGGLASRDGGAWLIAAACLAIAVLLAFPLYFRRANASFEDGTLPVEQVADELRRWSRWHWARVGIACAAFGSSVVAL